MATATSTSTKVTPPASSDPVVLKQNYFVPKYGVTVLATSTEEAVTLAKKAKGNK